VGSLTLEELYDLTDLLINPHHGLYESIGVHEVSTLNLKQTYYLFEFFTIHIFVYKKDRVPL
jgi:hypothetical protein